jgi:hypothetical protein
MSSPRSTHSPTRYRLSRTVLCEAYALIADTWCAMAAGLSGQSHRGTQPRPISAIGRSIWLCCTLSVLAQRCGNLRPSVRTEAYEAARVHYAHRRRGGCVATRGTRRFDTTEHNLRSTSVSRPLAARLTRLLHARSGSASSAAAKVFPIPAFSFQGSDSAPGVILAKQRPKFPTALREPLAKPLLKQDR